MCCYIADPCSGSNGEEDNVAAILGSHEFKGCTFRIERGDYSGILSKVVENLEKATVCIKEKELTLQWVSKQTGIETSRIEQVYKIVEILA